MTENVSVIDIVGDVVPSTEDMLYEAFAKCDSAQVVVLNFTDLAYMNSGGVGLLVTMLVRAQRNVRRCGRTGCPITTVTSSN